MMKVIKTIPEMRVWADEQRQLNRKIGLVPTMGYLHEGHLSLIRAAREKADGIVVSIYVNPTQFSPGEDLDRYPRDFSRDENLCKQEGAAAIFYPANEDMYLSGHATYVLNEEMGQKLCGRSRPIHFRGVTTIVAKLFNIVQPDFAVFGQKDAQQAIILKKMIQDMNFNTKLIIAPTAREKDGLAMSSRNKYLSPRERTQAPVLFKCLQLAEADFDLGNNDLENIRYKMTQFIEENSVAKIDYIEFVDAESLGPPEPDKNDILLAIAVFFGKTRLIDNTILEPVVDI